MNGTGDVCAKVAVAAGDKRQNTIPIRRLLNRSDFMAELLFPFWRGGNCGFARAAPLRIPNKNEKAGSVKGNLSDQFLTCRKIVELQGLVRFKSLCW